MASRTDCGLRTSPMKKLDLPGQLRHGRLQFMAHVILLLLIAGEDTDLADVSIHKMFENGGPKGSGTAGDHQGCSRKC